MVNVKDVYENKSTRERFEVFQYSKPFAKLGGLDANKQHYVIHVTELLREYVKV